MGAGVAAAMGAIGLILAVIGIYGIVSFSTAQRTHEIGIRMALGGSAYDVMRLILQQGARMVITGLAVGVLAALGITRVMTGLLVGVSPNDPLTYLRSRWCSARSGWWPAGFRRAAPRAWTPASRCATRYE